MAVSSFQSLTVVTDDDAVPDSVFDKEPKECTVEQLKRWLKCKGFKLRAVNATSLWNVLKIVKDCIDSGNHHTLHPSI